MMRIQTAASLCWFMLFVLQQQWYSSSGFTVLHNAVRTSLPVAESRTNTRTTPLFAQITEKEAQGAIDKVVAALRKDSQANEELGRLEKVTVILGYGSPRKGSYAVRFNAQFKKGGFGLSAVPLPFGLGQSDKSEGRGTMVGQVKASVDASSGKVQDCSVFRDLGYGRAFNLKC